MKNANKIVSMLVLLTMLATVLPSVNAASTIGTLTTVDDKEVNVLVEKNMTSADLSELIGLSLDEDDTLYISYFNTTGVATHTSFSPVQDSDDIVWWNISITDMNASTRKIFFDDETLTAANYLEASPALYVNQTVDADTFAFIVTIPDGVTFTFGKYSFEFDGDENMTVYDSDGDETGNLSSYEYASTYKVYGMNYSDDSSSHQIVFVDETPHDTATAATGKRVTVSKWYWFDTKVDYAMSTESTTDYNMFTTESGYLAFDVYNDYTGFLGKYTGGTVPFRMTASSLEYGTKKWYTPWKTTWTAVSTSESEVSGIKIGLIEYIYLSEETGAEEHDELLRDNYGVVCSRGTATTVSGILNIVKMMTSRTPEAVVNTDALSFS